MIKIFKKKYNNPHDLKIDLFFKHVNWYKLLVRVWGLYPTFSSASDKILELKTNADSIKRIWMHNPNLYLPQILSGMGILDRMNKKVEIRSNWFFYSIEDMLSEMGIPEREYILWVSYYNIFNQKRKEPKYMLIKDMSTRHIKKVLTSSEVNLSNKKRDIFMNELQERKK